MCTIDCWPPDPLFVCLYVKFFLHKHVDRLKPIMWIFFFRSFLSSANLPSAIESLWRHHSSSQSSPLSKKPGPWSCEAFNRGTLIIKSVCFTSGRQFWPLVVVSRRTQGKNRFFSCNIKRTLTVDKPNISRLQFKMFMKFIFSRKRFQMLRCSFTMFMVGTLLELYGSLTALNQLRLRCSPLLFCRTFSPH